MADATKAQSDKDLDRFFIEDPNDLPPEEQDGEETPENDDDAQEEGNPPDEDADTDAPEETTEQPDKFKGKSLEEIKNAYKNLETMMGKQAQELGELRKAVTQPAEPSKKHWTAADIPVIPDADLDYVIAQHEAYLLTPDQALTDSENFPAITIQYNKLMAEKAKREALKATKSITVTQANNAVVSNYHGNDAVTADELDQMKQYALQRLTDTGEITKDDLDVAMHKLFPGKWVMLNADKERKRIAKAQTEATPRIVPDKAGGGSKALKTPEELGKMSDIEYEQYLDSLSDTELKALKERIRKG